MAAALLACPARPDSPSPPPSCPPSGAVLLLHHSGASWLEPKLKITTKEEASGSEPLFFLPFCFSRGDGEEEVLAVLLLLLSGLVLPSREGGSQLHPVQGAPSAWPLN